MYEKHKQQKWGWKKFMKKLMNEGREMYDVFRLESKVSNVEKRKNNEINRQSEGQTVKHIDKQ